MRDVGRMAVDAVGVGRLQVIAFLVPAPVGGCHLLAGDGAYVVLHVEQVEGRVLVGLDRLHDLVAHERQRQRCIRLVERRRRRALVVGAVGRLHRRGVEVRAGIGACVAHDRLAAALGDHRIDVVAAGARMQRPLRLARLARDHRDRVRRRRADDGLMHRVEQGEAVGELPQERHGVAVVMGHDELALLLGGYRRIAHRGHASRDRDDLAALGRQAFLVERIAIVGGDAVGDIERVVDPVCEWSTESVSAG